MDSKASLIFRLARFLRLNGEKVMNGTCKLSLTTSALSLINSVFIDILMHDRFESNSSLYIGNHLTHEFLEDAQFLLDFFRKTPFLKLFHGMQTLRGGIDVSNFKGLTALELRKIPAHLIVGLNTLLHLKALICNRSIGSLKELFGSCTEENKSDGLWSELKELNVSCNYLEGLDDSLGILPNIEILDASHNSLKHLDELMVLDKLVVLNLNYNMLGHLPVLSICSSFTLKVLLMRNNNLEDLEGLENLINLEEFDVSYNCLSEYHVLKPLQKLKFLKLLHLENNPLSLYKQHREETARYFHPEVVKRGVVFDGKTLSAKDILTLQSHTSRKISQESGLGHQTSINVIVEDVENVITRSDHHYKTLRHTTTVKEEIPQQSPTVEKGDGSPPSSYSENTDEDGFRNKTKNRKKFRKKVREVVILQPEETPAEDGPVLEKMQGSINDTEIPSHILTKKLIETRRKEYGSEWLIPSHSFQTLVIDERIHIAPTNTPVSTSVNSISQSQDQLNPPSDLSVEPVHSCVSESHDSLPEAKSLHQMNERNNALSQVGLCVDDNNSSTSQQAVKKHSVVSDDIQVLDSTSNDQTLQNHMTDSDANLSELNVYEHFEQNKKIARYVEDVAYSDSEEENEDRIFLLERKEKEKFYPLFVSIGSRLMKEKDFQTGKLTDFLDLTGLFSIKLNERSMGDVVKYEISLAFDTLKASKQKRFYIFDDMKSAKHMASILQPFADAKTFEDTALGALECLKCCSQFSKQVARRKVLQKKKWNREQDSLPSSYDSTKGYIEEADVCPNCGSNMVVEMETIPLPSMMLPSSKESSVTIQKHLSQSEVVKEDTAYVSTSPPLGHISSMLYSMMKYTKTKRSPLSSSPKEKSDMEENKENAKADCIGIPHDLNENVTQGLEQTEFKAVFENRDLTSTPKMRRNSSDITLQSNPSQSSIAVISSDSDCDMPLDVIPERDSLCSPAPILPLLPHDFEKNFVLYSSGMYPAPMSASPSSGSACTAVEEFCEPRSSEDHVACKTKYDNIYSDNQSVERKSRFADELSLTLSCNDSIGQVSDKEFQDCEDSFSCCEHDSPPLDESTSLINLLSKKETVGYEKFSSIDHRLKLYLEFTVFGKDEELEACLEADIVQLSNDSEFKGFFVFSCKKIYVMKLLKEIGDDIARCVQKLHSWPLNQLKVIKLLPGSQGFAATCGSDKIFIFLIQDSDCCNCFISCITDVIRHRLQGAHFPRFETSITEALDQIKKEVFSTFFCETSAEEKEFEVVLYLLVFWCSGASGQQELQRVALIVASNYLFVAKVSYVKQISQRKQVIESPLLQYQALVSQKISNIVEIQLKENLKEAKFNFLDEQNVEYSWTILAETKSSLFALINVLKSPWETLFGINLPLCLCKDVKAVVPYDC